MPTKKYGDYGKMRWGIAEQEQANGKIKWVPVQTPSGKYDTKAEAQKDCTARNNQRKRLVAMRKSFF